MSGRNGARSRNGSGYGAWPRWSVPVAAPTWVRCSRWVSACAICARSEGPGVALCGAMGRLYWPDGFYSVSIQGHPGMTLRLHRDVDGPCLTPEGSVVAIGAFDGL